jgi:hypothetical protein
MKDVTIKAKNLWFWALVGDAYNPMICRYYVEFLIAADEAARGILCVYLAFSPKATNT